MPLLLVRHAFAGDRTKWEGDDRLRPLAGRGWRHAEELIAQLAGFEFGEILASPYLRCLQTVEPLARARGLEVDALEELGQERQHAEGIPLLRSLAGRDVVVCGHGGLDSAVPEGPTWKKGVVFVLGPDLELLEVLEPAKRQRGGR